MCEAEDALQGMECEVKAMDARIQRICDAIEDCDRGLLTIADLRREITHIREGNQTWI